MIRALLLHTRSRRLYLLAERRARGHYEAAEVLSSGYRVIENDSLLNQLTTALNNGDDAEFGRLFRAGLEAQRYDYHLERVEAGE